MITTSVFLKLEGSFLCCDMNGLDEGNQTVILSYINEQSEHITHLNIYGADEIKDLSVLETCTGLQTLKLSSCPKVEDLYVLETCTNLSGLSVAPRTKNNANPKADIEAQQAASHSSEPEVVIAVPLESILPITAPAPQPSAPPEADVLTPKDRDELSLKPTVNPPATNPDARP